MKWIDKFLNGITMYRLALYYLLALIVLALMLSLGGSLAFSASALVASTVYLLILSVGLNKIFAKIFPTSVNVESAYITALILALVVTPKLSVENFIFEFWLVLIAIASKFILTYRNKHLFNPVAVSGVVVALFIGKSSSWWVGTGAMLPLVIIGGLLIIRKLKRADMTVAFLLTSLVVFSFAALSRSTALLPFTKEMFLSTPLVFFASIMLVEPLTTPPGRWSQVAYGSLAGLLFAPQAHLGSFYSSPEAALFISNLFSFAISPKGRLVLELERAVAIGKETYEFIFKTNQPFKFAPGQYIEWTMGVDKPDSRGNRRFFTIASSPTENRLKFGVKFYEKSSRFKKTLLDLKPGYRIAASGLAGSFTLPISPSRKCVFIAGGIGVTPFRSMAKYLIDKQEKRDIVMFYSNKTAPEIVYRDIFDQAEAFGFKTIYTLTEPSELPQSWKGKTGFVDQTMITENVPDYKQRSFYISGPHGMVTTFESTLKHMGIPKSHIVVDYFPGFA